MASTHTISRSVRETVHSISIGRQPLWGQDTLDTCHNIGLIDITGRLTPAGEAVARAEVWGLVQGLTDAAHDIKNTDDRTDIESKAGSLLDLVA